jgi:glycyl-tRNA synthetase beta chain
MPAFLLEIGLEEVPASMIAAAQAEMAQRVEKLLRRERLATDALRVTSFSTPRRLAVLAEGLLAGQPDMEEEVVGPSTKVAYKDGIATPAAIAFAKKSGIEVSELKKIKNAKGEYVAATVRRRGRTAAQVLTGNLPAEMAGIYWPKSMYWRAGKPERFVRPVRWLLALLDKETLPLEFAGIAAGRVSYGHRVLHGDAPVEVNTPQEYAERLAAAYVEVAPDARRIKIRHALDAAARQIAGARWREDEDLVETVTNFTEWPSVIVGSFERTYLDLPEEVLVTVMRDHQKYFALEDGEKKLLPNFLAVLNLEVDEAGAAVIRHGNERVLRARFNDARFFWDVDQEIPLVDRVEMLKSVTFQKDLGSYWDKTERNRAVARNIIDRCDPPLFEAGSVKFSTFCGGVDQAALLAKTDLTTEMVKEFTELQGVVGGLYARAQRLPDGVARAIYDHYKPASQTDSVPRTLAGSVVALADKMSTIVDLFAIGLQPTGSKDPFALRRAGNGVVKILAEASLPLLLPDLQQAATYESAPENAELTEVAVARFLAERVDFYLREVCGFQYDTATAVMAAGWKSIRDTVARGKAVEEVRSLPDFLAISAAFKRTKNILIQAGEKDEAPTGTVDESLLRDAAEKQLWEKSQAVGDRVSELRRNRGYREALEAIATLRPDVDRFFDEVMVMVPEPEIRRNRLLLLQRILIDFSQIADFSEIVVHAG